MTTPGPNATTTTSLVVVETYSLARGLASIDACLKEADVELAWTRTIEPGRLVFLLRGGVEDLRSSLRAGRELLGPALTDALFLAHTHPAVLGFATGMGSTVATTRSETALPAAVGVIECETVATTILAADTAVKRANVNLVRLKLAERTGGRGLLVVEGATADVESAVNAGATVAESRGHLTHTETITAPDVNLVTAIAGC